MDTMLVIADTQRSTDDASKTAILKLIGARWVISRSWAVRLSR